MAVVVVVVVVATAYCTASAPGGDVIDARACFARAVFWLQGRPWSLREARRTRMYLSASSYLASTSRPRRSQQANVMSARRTPARQRASVGACQRGGVAAWQHSNTAVCQFASTAAQQFVSVSA